MLDFLSTLFQSLAPLWEMSVTAAYATAVVIVLRLLLKKRAPRQVLCLLWLVVFARLLIPVSLKSPLSIVPNALPGQEQQIHLPNQSSGAEYPVTPIQPQSPTQNSTANQPANGTVTLVPGNPTAPSLTVPEGVTPATPQPEAPAPFPWQTALAGVWLAGVAALTLYALFSYLRLRRCLFDAIRAEDGAWEHPAVNSPFILGLIRPRIYLPAGLSGQPRQFILCHERAHLRRLDHIVKPVCWAALALHWFNPAVWLAFILMSRDIEAACDEAVIRRLGPRVKADYSATLLALATSRRVPTPCPLAFDEGNAKGRIKNVLRYRRPALWIVVVSVIAAVVAAVCLLTDPVAAREPDADADPSSSADPSQAPVSLADTLLDPWMREVLDGDRTFRDFYRGHNYGDSQEFNIHQLRTMVYGDEELPKLTLEVGRLTILDLDRDGINEVVVWPVDTLGERDDPTEIGYYTGYFIFRRQGDTVYSYNPGWRAMGELKADGTFEWSGSAFEWGTGSARFTENGFETNPITWCDNGMYDEHYYVDGLAAEKGEFDRAVYLRQYQPDPIWYTYSDGALTRVLPSIPLDEYTLSAPVPDFLDEEQQLLYRRAYALYSNLFGVTNDSAHFYPGQGVTEPPAEQVERDGIYYSPEYGRFARWDDFEQAMLSVFTRNSWEAKNYSIDGRSPSIPIYINVDGWTYYFGYGRSGGDYNGNSPETFRLVEQTDDVISFVMTGYYTNWAELDNETFEEYIARQNGPWEYSIDFPMRMVKTENGWRFDEFHLAFTDDVSPFYSQRVLNPNAPAAATSSPEPSPDPTPSTSPVPDPEDTPSVAPVACEHGLDDAISGWSDGYLVLTCDLDGTAYPVPAVTQGDWEEGISEDFDGDGRVEHSFFQNGLMMIVDMEGGQLVTSTFDPSSTFAAFDQGSTWEMAEDYTALTVSYLSRTVQVPLYISGGPSFPEVVISRSFTPESIYPFTSETIFPYTGYIFRGNHFDMSSPVELGKVYADNVSLSAHWSVRYTGGGFQVLSDSFQFELVSR